MGRLRRGLGRNSRIGAIILLMLSVSLVVLSYKYPNIVIEVNSVVAFAAAIVLLYKDTTHSVQLRVVDRILESSRDLMRNLASIGLPNATFTYVRKGDKITDVVIVPSLQSDGRSEGVPEPEKAKTAPVELNSIELVPAGRSLAQLFLREMPAENPGFEDLIRSLPTIISESLGLCAAASMTMNTDIVEVALIHPVLKNSCGTGEPAQIALLCETCSLLAVLICYTTRRTVVIEGCSHNERKDVSTIRLRLRAKVAEAGT